MMRPQIAAILALLLTLSLFSGCTGGRQPNDTTPATEAAETQPVITSTEAAPVATDFAKTDADMFTQRDLTADFDANKAVSIQLNGTDVSSSSNTVKISGSRVTITEEATYIISGQLANGMLIVNAKDTSKIQLVFNGVDITSETSAALYVLAADKVFVTLVEGTENTLANGGSFTPIDENNIDGALFSKQDLTLNGTGALTVVSPTGHGVVCKDDLVIAGGSYTINAAAHGLDANDSIRITEASLTIDAGKDAIHAENSDDSTKGFVYISGGTVNGEAEGDGISASAYMQIAGGNIDLLVGGGSENASKKQSDYFGGFMGGGGKGPGSKRPQEMQPGRMQPNGPQTMETEDTGTSMKGMKAGESLLISGGAFNINSADDAIHSNASIVINGGAFRIASGDDAVHAEESLTVTSCEMDISNCYEGLEALHVDVQGGNIKLIARDDGLNAAGGTDQSGVTGGRDGMFGGGKGGPGGGWMSGNSNGSVKISGGTLYINSSGDGIDANGVLEISGGHTTVVGPTQGDTATLDYDKTGIITGGTFIGTGSTMMAQSFSDSPQGVIAVKAGNQLAGTKIQLADSTGNILIDREPELNFAIVILSSPELVKGEKYMLTIGAQSMEITAY